MNTRTADSSRSRSSPTTACNENAPNWGHPGTLTGYVRSVRRPPYLEVTRSRRFLTGLKTHGHFGNTGRNVETGRAFDTDRLKGNRIVGASDQHVGAGPDADRRTCGDSAIRSGKRSRREIDRRCNHRPDHHPAL